MSCRLLYMCFWVFPRRQIVVGRRFGTLCQFHLQRLYVDSQKMCIHFKYLVPHSSVGQILGVGSQWRPSVLQQCLKFVGPSMKHNSYHPSGAWNFEVGYRFLVNLCTVAIQNAKTLFYSSTTTGEDEKSA